MFVKKSSLVGIREALQATIGESSSELLFPDEYYTRLNQYSAYGNIINALPSIVSGSSWFGTSTITAVNKYVLQDLQEINLSGLSSNFSAAKGIWKDTFPSLTTISLSGAVQAISNCFKEGSSYYHSTAASSITYNLTCENSVSADLYLYQNMFSKCDIPTTISITGTPNTQTLCIPSYCFTGKSTITDFYLTNTSLPSLGQATFKGTTVRFNTRESTASDYSNCLSVEHLMSSVFESATIYDLETFACSSITTATFADASFTTSQSKSLTFLVDYLSLLPFEGTNFSGYTSITIAPLYSGGVNIAGCFSSCNLNAPLYLQSANLGTNAFMGGVSVPAIYCSGGVTLSSTTFGGTISFSIFHADQVYAANQYTSNVFAQCNALKEVTLTNTSTLFSAMFSGVQTLESITLGYSSAITLTYQCFSDCLNLKTFNCSGYFSTIPSYAFFYTPNLILPSETLSECTAIGECGCYSMGANRSVGNVLPLSKCTTVGSSAFYGANIGTIIFSSKTAVTIYGDAFYGASIGTFSARGCFISRNAFRNLKSSAAISLDVGYISSGAFVNAAIKSLKCNMIYSWTAPVLQSNTNLENLSLTFMPGTGISLSNELPNPNNLKNFYMSGLTNISSYGASLFLSTLFQDMSTFTIGGLTSLPPTIKFAGAFDTVDLKSVQTLPASIFSSNCEITSLYLGSNAYTQSSAFITSVLGNPIITLYVPSAQYANYQTYSWENLCNSMVSY